VTIELTDTEIDIIVQALERMPAYGRLRRQINALLLRFKLGRA